MTLDKQKEIIEEFRNEMLISNIHYTRHYNILKKQYPNDYDSLKTMYYYYTLNGNNNWNKYNERNNQ
jgi:hypothetical protein